MEEDEEPVQEVFIRDQLSEVIELVPSVPRLHKLNSLLRGREYDEGHEDEDMVSDDDDDDTVGGTEIESRRDEDADPRAQQQEKRPKFTYEDARSIIQASDAELDKGLRERRVLILNGQPGVAWITWDFRLTSKVSLLALTGELRPIARSHLTTILELILTNLVSLSLPHTAAPIATLLSALEDDHDIRRVVSRQVLGWFGRVDEGKATWEMDVDAVIREVGLGILRAYRVRASLFSRCRMDD